MPGIWKHKDGSFSRIAVPYDGTQKAAIESMIGSAGILLAGFATIPFAAHLVGAQVSTKQGVWMSVIFFLWRWAYLYMLRTFFAKKEQLNG